MKKLLIITGAGASLDFGMPSVAEIDKLFEKWACEIAPLASNPNKSFSENTRWPI
jgi:NAD-dependent SIR2 family protein deacetylase